MVGTSGMVCVCMYIYVRAFVRVCACTRACVHVCVHVYVSGARMARGCAPAESKRLRWLLGRPKEAPETPEASKRHQRHQRGTREAPEAPEAPKRHQRHQRGTREAPEAPERHQRGTREAPEAPKRHQRHQRGTREAPERHQRATAEQRTHRSRDKMYAEAQVDDGPWDGMQICDLQRWSTHSRAVWMATLCAPSYSHLLCTLHSLKPRPRPHLLAPHLTPTRYAPWLP